MLSIPDGTRAGHAMVDVRTRCRIGLLYQQGVFLVSNYRNASRWNILPSVVRQMIVSSPRMLTLYRLRESTVFVTISRRK